MLRKLFILSSLFLFCTLASGQEYPKEKLQEIVLDHLKKEGYVPELDKDGDITFRYQGLTFFIFVYENDKSYFRTMLPLFRISEEEDLVRALSACNHATMMTKIAKAFMTNSNSVRVTTEIAVSKPQEFPKLISRCLEAAVSCRGSFLEKFRELKER